MGVDCYLSANTVKAWREWRRNRENARQTPCERDKLGRCKTCYAVQQLPARSGMQIKRGEIHRKTPLKPKKFATIIVLNSSRQQGAPALGPQRTGTYCFYLIILNDCAGSSPEGHRFKSYSRNQIAAESCPSGTTFPPARQHQACHQKWHRYIGIFRRESE
jgi:hypothetical protein